MIVTVAIAVALVVGGVTAAIRQVAVVLPAVIKIGDTQVVVYCALAAGGVKVTDKPPAVAAAVEVKVTVDEPPVLLLSVVGAAATLMIGATSSSFTLTAALSGAPTA